MLALLRVFALALSLLASPAWSAIDVSDVVQLGADDSDARVEAIRKLTATQDPRAAVILNALLNDALVLIDDGKRAAIVVDGRLLDAATGTEIGPAPERLEPLIVNNRLRGEIDTALAALNLASPVVSTRLAAARSLQGSDNEELLPLVQRALERETDAQVANVLGLSAASLALKNDDPALRMRAATALAKSSDPQVRQMLSGLVVRLGDGNYAEPDARVRAAAAASLAEINRRLR
jgi:urea transport system permease protein